jgi:hypothetical protein
VRWSGTAFALRAFGDLDEDPRQLVGLTDVWAVAGRDLDWLNAEALARHASLPVGPDRAVLAGDDVRRGSTGSPRAQLPVRGRSDVSAAMPESLYT